MKKPKILFVYDHQYPNLWRDGLWRALKELENDFEIDKWNLQAEHFKINESDYDFVLGWGAFGSPVDNELKKDEYKLSKKGLCIGGNASQPEGINNYDVLFYETEWYKEQIKYHPNIIHAFGVNTDIYRPLNINKIYDCLTIGAFALWKRQIRLLDKTGVRMAVGEIQKGNSRESLSIILPLLNEGVGVMDMVEPETLVKIINTSKSVYIPSDIYGGGERAVLEARACGVDVEVESDNPKLKELTESQLYDYSYYYKQLAKGISSCLS